jgi:DNA-binding CsgD family transcriptional regulator
MPDMDSTLPEKRSEPALVLLDSALRAVSYNAEAVEILTYPQHPKEIPQLTSFVDAKLRPLLSLLCSHPETPPRPILQSGKRRYSVRLFSLNDFRNCSPCGNSHCPAHAVLIERQDRRVVDLATAAAQFHLTRRELETLGFLVQGLTSKEIANRMGISPHTVAAFLRLVMGKMQVSTRSGVVGKILTINV